MWKVNFEKKSSTSDWEMSVSCTIQECKNVTSPFPISCLLSVKWPLALWEAKNKRKVKFFALKAVAVAYERWPRTWNSKYNEFTLKRLVFWETGCWEEVVADICLTAFPLLAGQHYKRKAREPCQKITWKGLGIKPVKGLTLLSFILSWCLGWDTFFYLRLWRDFIRMESYNKY